VAVKKLKKKPPMTGARLRAIKMPKTKKVSGDVTAYDVVKAGISHSTLTSWLACRQRCAFKLEGWSRIAPKDAAEFGKLFHYYLERMYGMMCGASEVGKPLGTDKDREKMKDSVGVFTDEYEKKNAATISNIQAWEVMAATAEAVFKCYVDVWWKDDTKRYEWVALEADFKQPFNGVMLKGYRDGLFRFKGSLWLLETKTKGRIDSELDDAISFDGQNLFYITATEEEKKEPVAGALYNVVRRPGIQVKNGEAPKDYAERVVSDIIKQPDHYFKRYVITYGEKVKSRFRAELTAKLDEFQKWQAGQLPTYRNESACLGIFNCEFIQLCGTGSTAGYTKGRD
jgi:hypothetical protein